MTKQTTPSAIYCDDCGREKMAELRDGKLVIADRRHGRRHVAVLPLSGLIRLAQNDEEETNG